MEHIKVLIKKNLNDKRRDEENSSIQKELVCEWKIYRGQGVYFPLMTLHEDNNGREYRYGVDRNGQLAVIQYKNNEGMYEDILYALNDRKTVNSIGPDYQLSIDYNLKHKSFYKEYGGISQGEIDFNEKLKENKLKIYYNDRGILEKIVITNIQDEILYRYYDEMEVERVQHEVVENIIKKIEEQIKRYGEENKDKKIHSIGLEYYSDGTFGELGVRIKRKGDGLEVTLEDESAYTELEEVYEVVFDTNQESGEVQEFFVYLKIKEDEENEIQGYETELLHKRFINIVSEVNNIFLQMRWDEIINTGEGFEIKDTFNYD